MPLRPAILILLLGMALGACGPTAPAPAGERIQRGTALPPPGLATPTRN
jgi:hypothetical protein